jgi:hypothetical protein
MAPSLYPVVQKLIEIAKKKTKKKKTRFKKGVMNPPPMLSTVHLLPAILQSRCIDQEGIM